MKRYGLLGEKLGHSYSPQIHGALADYPYDLYEVGPDKLGEFLTTTPLAGMNVTIPYKKAVLDYCADLSDAARKIGSVNTLVRRENGWYGDNTDYYGFCHMVRVSGIDIAGKKALVLGNGGVSLTVQQALADLGAAQVVVISRRGEDNYENLDRHSDAKVIVNTTPVGMYPNNGQSVVSLARFGDLCGVLDLIYNPDRTALLLQAQERGIPAMGGLVMLVAQAKRAAELFTGMSIDDAKIAAITRQLQNQMLNVVLVGMPGCGKSTVGRQLAEKLGRPFYDADEVLTERAGCSIPEIFRNEGEAAFRELEHQVLVDLGKLSGAVIATGGGCVTRRENYAPLHQNGRIFWLQRDLEKLPTDGRPISQSTTAQALYQARKPLYEAFSDTVVDNNAGRGDAAARILEELI